MRNKRIRATIVPHPVGAASSPETEREVKGDLSRARSFPLTLPASFCPGAPHFAQGVEVPLTEWVRDKHSGPPVQLLTFCSERESP